MDDSGGNSEVARVTHRIDLELEAAGRSLHGFAITARHDFINARIQQQGERILHLIEQGRHEEAQALLNTGDWGEKRQSTIKPPRRTPAQKKGRKREKRG